MLNQNLEQVFAGKLKSYVEWIKNKITRLTKSDSDIPSERRTNILVGKEKLGVIEKLSQHLEGQEVEFSSSEMDILCSDTLINTLAEKTGVNLERLLGGAAEVTPQYAVNSGCTLR